MPTILITWELGGGLGHMMPIRLAGQRLVWRGYRVFAAVRDLQHAHRLLTEHGIAPFQAPFKQKPLRIGDQTILSYAHILRNTAFGDADELAGLADAWRNVIDLVEPNIILFNHSPTAMLAARASRAKRVIFGTGFHLPPETRPLPVIRPGENPTRESVANDEACILRHANQVLARWGIAPMNALCELYYPNDGAYLFTLPSLDTFGPRTNVRYLGVQPVEGGEAPQWPVGDGIKVFAYLKLFKCLDVLLNVLNQLPARTLIYGPDITPNIKAKHGGQRISFATNPVDMKRVAEQCDVAVLNGTNAMVAQMLLAGKPMLNIPLVLEQNYNARAARKLGAGLIASPNRPAEITARITDLIQSPDLRQHVRKSLDNKPSNPCEMDEFLDEIEQMVTCTQSGTT